jgi:predicted TIM-barrel fold metal-dependent hydrolase
VGANRIDVHAHFLPPTYRDALKAAGLTQPDGIPGLPDWDTDTALSAMDRLGVATAMLSISSPGVHLKDANQAITLARTVNEAGARIVADHPDRFGLFASLPLPDVAAAIEEAIYALDTLHADGIGLLTNHRGLYLGNTQLRPLYNELNARSAVVFIHPTSAPVAPPVTPRPAPAFEFLFETTRTVIDLVRAGILEDYPKLRFIVPHAGAALPVVASRIDLFTAAMSSAEAPAAPSVREALTRLHYDLAGVPVDEQLAALATVAESSHLHFGSDYPFTPEAGCLFLAAQLEKSQHLDRAALACLAKNSRTLFPRLAAELHTTPLVTEPSVAP